MKTRKKLKARWGSKITQMEIEYYEYLQQQESKVGTKSGVRTGDGVPDGTKGNGAAPYHKIPNRDGEKI